MSWLTDTNVLSELVKPRPNTGVLDWAQTVERVSVSTITVEEILFGLAWKPNRRIYTAIMRFFMTSCDVLPVTQAIAERAGALRGEFRSRGITRSSADMLIAATAQVHHLTLVTRNTRDFEGIRVDVLNPFA
jgi:toxin FitB